MPTLAEMKERHAKRIRQCRSCKAEIVWFKTKAEKWMPIDAATVKASDTQVNLGYHISHFATCPNAAKHRRRKPPGEHSRARR